MHRFVSAGELASCLRSLRVVGDESIQIGGIQYDSRKVAPGDLFAALPGSDADGHDYLAEAVLRGASALLVERPLLPAPENVVQIIVEDSRGSLADAAAAFFGHPSRQISVIGITGTDGKTTTSYLLSSIFRAAGVAVGLISTVAIRVSEGLTYGANRQTTPESVDVQRYLRQMVDQGSSWAIVEATSHGLIQHRLDRTRIAIGAVTNITHEHLEFHKTIEAYRRAKATLLERVGEASGTVVTNADDEGAQSIEMYAAGASLIRYSAEGADADFRATQIRMGPLGSRFNVESADGDFEINLPLLGEFNIENALCALAIASVAGVEPRAIADGLAAAPAVPGRMARISEG
nr:UDP-N-acetylmuramoyl-L-alanyl-D-glutamate--2,6-diaminopimelate ligase [Chloroflexota bacterium]